MVQVITFDKGSKRKLQQVRWKLTEVFSLALLAVCVFALSLLVMAWELRHEHSNPEPTKAPQIRDAEP